MITEITRNVGDLPVLGTDAAVNNASPNAMRCIVKSFGLNGHFVHFKA